MMEENKMKEIDNKIEVAWQKVVDAQRAVDLANSILIEAQSILVKKKEEYILKLRAENWTG